jgi:Glycosyltransferase
MEKIALPFLQTKGFVFWTIRPPFVTKGLLDEIASISGLPIVVVYLQDDSREDRAGINVFPPSSSEECINGSQMVKSKSQLKAFIRNHSDWIHIFTGVGFLKGQINSYLKSINPQSVSIVWTERPIYLGKFKRLKERIKYLLNVRLRLLYSKNVDLLFAYGEPAVKEFLSYGWPKNKVFPLMYCPNFSPTVPTADFKLAKNVKNILYVGRFDFYVKGVDVLMKSIAAINKTCQEKVRFYFAGGYGNDRAQIMKFIQSTPNCTFIGKTSLLETESIMPLFDAVIVPSVRDGWNVNPYLATMSGIPTLCSTGAGSQDLIEKYHCGLVFNGGDSTSLTATLKTFLNFGTTQFNELVNNAIAAKTQIGPRSEALYVLQTIDKFAMEQASK